MNRCLGFGLLLAFPGLLGCTPPGPPEFYRSALQARSEFVDSLSRVVDEKTAKEKYKTSEKVLNDRMLDIKEGLDRTKFDGNFNKLSRETFQLKNLDPGDRAGMIEGMKSYALYCKNIVFTNVRLKREIERLKMVANMEALNKARTQIESNQPVAGNGAAAVAEFSNLAQMFESLNKLNNVNLRFVPAGLTKKDLGQLNPGMPDSDIELILDFDVQNLNAKVPGLEPPALPPYPAWAIAIDQRTKWGLTQQPPAKR